VKILLFSEIDKGVGVNPDNNMKLRVVFLEEMYILYERCHLLLVFLCLRGQMT
jgi:hypothetical protein